MLPVEQSWQTDRENNEITGTELNRPFDHGGFLRRSSIISPVIKGSAISNFQSPRLCHEFEESSAMQSATDDLKNCHYFD